MAKLMRFKVLGGKHHHTDGKSYGVGEILSADTDLSKTFKNKFERQHDFEFPAPGADKASSKGAPANEADGKPAEEKTPEDEVNEAHAAALLARGKDVTGKFPLAPKNGYKVFSRHKHYSVYEPDETTPLKGCEGLEKNAVEPAIEKLLET